MIGLTKHDVYLKDVYFHSNNNNNYNNHRKSTTTTWAGARPPAHHCFAMQLSSGIRVYGHVRTYYPHHAVATSRIDVGRRSQRAMVILTRASSGHLFYQALLKSMEAITSNHYASTSTSTSPPLQSFLHQVHKEHYKLTKAFQASIQSSQLHNSPMPNLMTMGLKQLEIHHGAFSHVDLTKFIIPTSLLQNNNNKYSYEHDDAPILPLIRTVGIAHTIRILSALLAERRIIFVSSNTSKLTTCMNSLLSILAQGCLSWQHIYIPILPPTLLNYLAAPMPYLIGLQQEYASVQALERVGGLGEALAVYLDTNDLKIFGMSNPDLSIPDILSDYADISNGHNSGNSNSQMAQQYGYNNAHMMQPQQHRQQQHDQYPPQMQQMMPQYSIADHLKTDLIKIVKEDKKMRDTSSSGNTGAVVGAAVKGKDLIKKGFGKLKSAAKKTLHSNINSNSSSGHEFNNNSSHGGGMNGEDPLDNESAIAHPMNKDDLYMYNDGYDNEVCENEARMAFTTFFLTYIGDMRQFLRQKSKDSGGGPPSFDKDLFTAARMKVGEYKDSPMYKLSVHFKESQIFEQFVHARVDDITQRKEFSPRLSPLFVLAVKYHNAKHVPFENTRVRAILRLFAKNRPVNECIQVVSHVRARATSLTSNSRNEAMARMSIQRLVQECRECGIHLVEVMSVVWDRIRDSRGMQWKHGLYALQLIQELILHGPLGAVIEATDGLDKIRRMKSYEHSKSNVAQEVRGLAYFIYSLLVNRSRLFAMRRICAQKRRELMKPVRLVRDPRIDLFRNMNLRVHQIKFKKLHQMIKPNGIVSSSATTDLLGVEASGTPGMLQTATSMSLSQVHQTQVQPGITVAPVQVASSPAARQTHQPPPPQMSTQPVQQQLQTPAQQSHQAQGQSPLTSAQQPSLANMMANTSIAPAGQRPSTASTHHTIFSNQSVPVSITSNINTHQPPISPSHQGVINGPSIVPSMQQFGYPTQQNTQFAQPQQPMAPPPSMTMKGYHVQPLPQPQFQPNMKTNVSPTKPKASFQFDPFA